jgi:hypothetical protein
MDLVEIGWSGMDWIGLVQDRWQVANSCKCSNELSGSIKFWETLKWLHNWWPLDSAQLHIVSYFFLISSSDTYLLPSHQFKDVRKLRILVGMQQVIYIYSMRSLAA